MVEEWNRTVGVLELEGGKFRTHVDDAGCQKNVAALRYGMLSAKRAAAYILFEGVGTAVKAGKPPTTRIRHRLRSTRQTGAQKNRDSRLGENKVYFTCFSGIASPTFGERCVVLLFRGVTCAWHARMVELSPSAVGLAHEPRDRQRPPLNIKHPSSSLSFIVQLAGCSITSQIDS